MIVRAGRAQAETLHEHGRQGDEEHGQAQGRNRGQPQGEEGREHEHAAQGDEVHLDEVDDAHGVADHAEAQGDEGVNGPARQAAENVLQEIGKQDDSNCLICGTMHT
ncbi:hypothetical protein DSECCO2_349260 [anaerobic digester metagenome]